MSWRANSAVQRWRVSQTRTWPPRAGTPSRTASIDRERLCSKPCSDWPASAAGVAVAATRYTDATGAFLAFAPLVPLAAVSLTFAAATEPSGEAGIATPLHGGGLVVRRAVAVLGVAFIVLGVGAIAAPSVGAAPLGWILPAAAMALGSLALGTWVRLESAVIGLATGWIVGLGAARYSSGLDSALADTYVFTSTGQGFALLLALAAAAALAARADRYSMMEARL
jgi:hypothetical protein